MLASVMSAGEGDKDQEEGEGEGGGRGGGEGGGNGREGVLAKCNELGIKKLSIGKRSRSGIQHSESCGRVAYHGIWKGHVTYWH